MKSIFLFFLFSFLIISCAKAPDSKPEDGSSTSNTYQNYAFIKVGNEWKYSLSIFNDSTNSIDSVDLKFLHLKVKEQLPSGYFKILVLKNDTLAVDSFYFVIKKGFFQQTNDTSKQAKAITLLKSPLHLGEIFVSDSSSLGFNEVISLSENIKSGIYTFKNSLRIKQYIDPYAQDFSYVFFDKTAGLVRQDDFISLRQKRKIELIYKNF